MKSKLQDRINYWRESAEYDLLTAESMLREKRYLYVAFCCHLAAEKITKSYYWKETESEPIFTHNINLLLSKLKISQTISKNHQLLLDELIPLNIRSRYPDDKDRIYKLLTYNKCRSLIARTKDYFRWILKQINQ